MTLREELHDIDGIVYPLVKVLIDIKSRAIYANEGIHEAEVDTHGHMDSWSGHSDHAKVINGCPNTVVKPFDKLTLPSFNREAIDILPTMLRGRIPEDVMATSVKLVSKECAIFGTGHHLCRFRVI